MLKIRMQGTVQDIQWFQQLMERHKEIRMLKKYPNRLQIRGQIDISGFMQK